MVFAGFFISSARYVSVTVESTPPPDAVFVTGNFDVSGATLLYKDQLVVTPTDIEFKTDGTKLFVAVEGSTSIYEYSLSTAWDLTTVSADATTSLSVSNMSQVQTFDFNRNGTKLYACGSGNVAEFSLSSAYDLSTAGSQSTLDISVHSGQTIYGACFSNSVSNNYLHFTSSGTGNVNTISTLEIASPLSGSTFLGRSANVVPLINSVVAPDLHTTRTLEVSGGGSRFYQIYRNTDLSNVYTVEFKLGTPHDASTLTSATQIEDYFDLATQTGGTALYDTFNSLKIKPDGSEMFLSGTYYYSTSTPARTSLAANTGSNSGNVYFSRDLKYVLTLYQWTNQAGVIRIFGYDNDTGAFTLLHTLTGNANNVFIYGPKAIAKSGTRFLSGYVSGRYITINDYDGSSWSITQKITISSPYNILSTGGLIFSENEDMFFAIITGYTNPVGAIGVYTESGGTWSQTQLIRNPYTSSDSNFSSIAVSSDNTTLLLGDQFSNYNSTDNGVVFVYSNVAGTWTYTNQTLDSPYSGDVRFAGRGLDINSDGTRAFVGSSAYNSSQGAVHIYDYNGSTWSLSQTINGTGGTGTLFGLSVSCSSDGNRFIVGAWLESTNGRAHIYDYDGTTWSLSQTLTHVYGARRYGGGVGMAPDKSRLIVSETFTTSAGYIHYYTTPKNTQTYSLDVPTPVLYISGEKSNTYDTWSTSSDVAATGTGDFITVDTLSKVGSNCLTFDNSTTSVVVPNFPEANTLPMSVAFWYQKTNTDTEDVLFTTSSFNSASGTTAGFSIHAQSTQGKYIEVECNSTDYTRSSIECPNYQWNHVVVTIDSTGSVEIYINGTRDTSTTASGWDLTSSNFATGQNLIIGDDPTSTSHFGGYMDDIKVFNGALSEQSVKKIYLDGLAPAKTQVFHLTFEDDTGADILPSGASLGGTSLTTLQSNIVTYQGGYVGYFPGHPTLSNVQIQNWSSYGTPFTVSLWTYVIPYNATNADTNIYRYQTVFRGNEFYGNGGVSYTLDDQGTGGDPYSVQLGFRGGSSPPSVASSADLYLGNRWVHHCVSYDGTNVKIYINGVEKVSGTISGVTVDPGQMLTFFGTVNRVDPYNQVNLRNYKGYADDIRIYDYVLDPQEVEYLYTSTLVHKDQSFYLSYDQSNVYEYQTGTANVTATGTGVYYQDPGSKIGTHSGEYPQGTTGTVVPSWPGLTTATVLTFSMWVFPTELTAQTYYTLFCTTPGYENATTGIAGVLVNSSGNLQLQIVSKTTSSTVYRHGRVTLTSVSNFTNKWMHLVFVFTSNTRKIYINGAEQTLTQNTTWEFGGVPSGDDLRIGNYNSVTSEDFHGALDDFRVFKRELPDEEIAGLYRQYTQSRIYTVNVPANPVTLTPFTLENTGGIADVAYGTYNVRGDLTPSHVFDFSGNGGKTTVGGISTDSKFFYISASQNGLMLKLKDNYDTANNFSLELFNDSTYFDSSNSATITHGGGNTNIAFITPHNYLLRWDFNLKKLYLNNFFDPTYSGGTYYPSSGSFTDLGTLGSAYTINSQFDFTGSGIVCRIDPADGYLYWYAKSYSGNTIYKFRINVDGSNKPTSLTTTAVQSCTLDKYIMCYDFSTDGKKLIGLVRNEKILYEYDLTTGFDLTTINTTHVRSVPTEDIFGTTDYIQSFCMFTQPSDNQQFMIALTTTYNTFNTNSYIVSAKLVPNV